jgi:hypothetical protein
LLLPPLLARPCSRSPLPSACLPFPHLCSYSLALVRICASHLPGVRCCCSCCIAAAGPFATHTRSRPFPCSSWVLSHSLAPGPALRLICMCPPSFVCVSCCRLRMPTLAIVHLCLHLCLLVCGPRLCGLALVFVLTHLFVSLFSRLYSSPLVCSSPLGFARSVVLVPTCSRLRLRLCLRL